MPRIRKELGEQSNPKERRKLIMKFIFTVLLLTVLYRQRYRIYKMIKCLVCACAAYYDAWKTE
jgi:hypothetical protein